MVNIIAGEKVAMINLKTGIQRRITKSCRQHHITLAVAKAVHVYVQQKTLSAVTFRRG
ncbi:MAG: hypothetical protein PHS52_04500 [Desulfotomaculaceae bacterium]|nr:hypothetical protein [Desulfotomaculaceae bacterium]